MKNASSNSSIKPQIKKLEDDIVAALKKSVEIPTINPPGLNYPEFITFIHNLLKAWGIEHKIISGPAEDRNRKSIIGFVRGNDKKSLHFHGHYDVVPALGEDQFKPFTHDGKLFGRGSSDMKGGIIAMMYALKFLNEEPSNLNGTLTFSLAPDEETGGAGGIRHLFKEGCLPIKGCIGMIMPEPSSGVVWHASKGALTVKVNFKGKHAHIALADGGINAFKNMVFTAVSLKRLEDEISLRVTPLDVIPESAKKSVMLIGGECGSGINFNTVPEKAWFTIDRRFNPEEKIADVRNEIIEALEEEKRKGIDLSYEILQEGESSLSDSDGTLAKALSDSIREITGTAPRFELCPGLLETRFFSKYGIPSYAYGPGLLDISHGPNEYIEIVSLLNSIEIFVDFSRTLFASQD